MDNFNKENRKISFDTAIANGGIDDGKPGLRPHYREHYYAAFILDLDGHQIEAVCNKPE